MSRYFSTDDAQWMDNLREAANRYGAVAELVAAIEGGLRLDQSGHNEIDCDAGELHVLLMAQAIGPFVALDRAGDGYVDG